MTLAERLKQTALSLGFDVAGICSATASPHSDFFARWLDAGHAGEMDYLRRRSEERCDPRRLLPDCRSILAVGLNSYLPHESPSAPGRAIFARYAQRTDYHDLMLDRLRRLLDWLASETGQSPESLGRAYVDTGPVLEREWAAAAGLGWIGKNGCLIHPEYGSWLLLGELLLTIDLAPDVQQVVSRCGTCNRCIEACPTKAFTAPYNLDARRCISYLTIEHRGSIPTDVRPLVGQRVFGCDLCQDVCPWNTRFSQPPSDGEFQPRQELVAPLLIELMEASEEEFRRRFRGTPITRAKRRGLMRNVAVALGNLGDPTARPVLQLALDDVEPLVVEHAAWALEQLSG